MSASIARADPRTKSRPHPLVNELVLDGRASRVPPLVRRSSAGVERGGRARRLPTSSHFDSNLTMRLAVSVRMHAPATAPATAAAGTAAGAAGQRNMHMTQVQKKTFSVLTVLPAGASDTRGLPWLRNRNRRSFDRRGLLSPKITTTLPCRLLRTMASTAARVFPCFSGQKTKAKTAIVAK